MSYEKLFTPGKIGNLEIKSRIVMPAMGCMIAKGKQLTAVEDGSVTVKDTKSGEETRIPADTVILAMGVRSNRPEADTLREAFGEKLILVGDACKPGQIYDALHSAHDKAFVYAAR